MRTLSLIKTFTVITVRSKLDLFWLLLFPILLLLLLSAIFSSFEKPENLNFKVTLLRNSGKNAEIVEKALEKASKDGGEKKSVISLTVEKLGDDDKVLKKEIEKLKESKIHALIVVPEEFESDFNQWMYSLRTPNPAEAPEIKVYSLNGSQSSEVAADIVNAIMKGVNNSLLATSKIKVDRHKLDETYLGAKKKFGYKDFLFPGVLMMAFMTTSIFGVGEEVVRYRTQGVLKRLSLSPVSSLELFLSFNTVRMAIMVIQFILLSLVAVFHLKTNLQPLDPPVLLYSVLATVTLMSLSFMMASLIPNLQQATVITNLFFTVMMFLGGLFFDVFNIPIVLRWFVYLNPVTYLASGMRASLGISKVPYPDYLSYVVPLAWILVSVLISARFFRWTEER